MKPAGLSISCGCSPPVRAAPERWLLGRCSRCGTASRALCRRHTGSASKVPPLLQSHAAVSSSWPKPAREGGGWKCFAQKPRCCFSSSSCGKGTKMSDELRMGFLLVLYFRPWPSTSAKDLGSVAFYPGQVLLLVLFLPCLNIHGFLVSFFFFFRYNFVLDFWCDLLYSMTITFLALMSLLPLSS